MQGTRVSLQGCAFKIEDLVALTTTWFYVVKLRAEPCSYGCAAVSKILFDFVGTCMLLKSWKDFKSVPTKFLLGKEGLFYACASFARATTVRKNKNKKAQQFVTRKRKRRVTKVEH